MSKPKPGTPLPAALSGQMIERAVRIDRALLYLVSGALEYLTDREPLEETGTLTVEDARLALADMLYCFVTGCSMIPIGSMVMWFDDTIPDMWVAMGASLSKATYPELFDIFGYTFGGGGDTFVLPTMAGHSPYGAGADVSLGDTGGSDTRTLNIGNLPAHNHDVTDPGHTHNVAHRSGGTAGGNAVLVAGAANIAETPLQKVTSSATTGISTQNTGSGNPFSILHPVRGVIFIIYAGH